MKRLRKVTKAILIAVAVTATLIVWILAGIWVGAVGI
jgi:hypothetical protein